MILRKPYAFLIKKFKLIHLILTFLSIYLLIKTNNLLGYFNNFIDGTVSKIEAIEYISNTHILVILLSIAICLVVLILMKHKKKPFALYLILISIYLAIGLIISITNNGLNEIYFGSLETKTLLLYRDILRILIIIQFISLCFIIVRALGFDIKKFNFANDLEDLNIELTDDEEVELTLGSTNTIRRKINRKTREFKYYYVENKLFINVIIIVIIFFSLSGLFVSKEVINKVYNEQETFTTDNFNITVLNSYISNKSSDNKKITDTNTSFVIIKLNITPKSNNQEFNVGKLILNIGKNSYASKTLYANKFKDLGYSYNGKKISSSTDYIFIYNVENEYLNDKMTLIYNNDKEVKLNPLNLDEISETSIYNLTEEINLSTSLFKTGTFKINSFEINDKFNYIYEYEVSGQVYESNIIIKSTNNTILYLNITSSLPSNLDNYSLLSEYATIKYKIEDKEYQSTSNDNKTPGNYKEGLYINVDKNIEQAEKIWIDIKIRNKQYIYNLK